MAVHLTAPERWSGEALPEPPSVGSLGGFFAVRAGARLRILPEPLSGEGGGNL